jgi:predicted helicase
MRHMRRRQNLGLITTAQTRDTFGALATRTIATHKSVAAYDINSLFPLYLYPAADGGFLDEPGTPSPRVANLRPALITDLEQRLGLHLVPDGTGDLRETFGPEDVFAYTYAILHCPTYRTRYAEFLKRDFPRIPFTSDRTLFAGLVGKGRDLVALHLLESPLLNDLTTSFPEPGAGIVEYVRYHRDEERVHINRQQYFDGVPPRVWDFMVGGYQVCDKWLKDRKGRVLSYDDTQHYARTVRALDETIRLMAEIDGLIPVWPVT